MLAVGLSVGLTLHLRPRVIEVKPTNQISFPNGESVSLTEIKLKDVNLFGPNVEATVVRSQAVSGRRRLL